MLADILSGQCAAQSAGTVNGLVATLVQALLTAQCALSPPEYWPQDYGDHALAHGLDAFDFVVIGAGSAGSVVASRLSENPDWKVLVLEAGGDPPHESEVPSLFFTIQHTKYDWQYTTEPNGRSCLAMKEQRSYWPRGKMIGGSSALNAMLYIRGNRKDYDGWLAKGNDGWGWDDVVPYFEKSVRPVGNKTHPMGYISVNEFARFNTDIQDLLYAGAAELNQPHVSAFGEGSTTGYTNLPGSVRNGERMSTGKSHLGKVGDRPNLRVIKHAHVTKLNFDASGKRVESVAFVVRGEHHMTAKVKKEAVLSAGTIDSAKLLLLSGVGPKAHLNAMEIPVVQDLRVGHNLQDHVIVPLFISLQQNVAQEQPATQQLDAIYNYLIHRDGPLISTGTAPLTGLINTEEGSSSPYPDIEYHHFFFNRGDFKTLDMFLNVLTLDDKYARPLHEALETAHLFVIFTSLAHPKTCGRLRLRSADYRDAPIIEPDYLSHPDDVATLLRAINYVERLQNTTAFREKDARFARIPIAECDKLEVTHGSEAYWRCYMKYFSTTMYHHTGTVKMGPASDGDACVDPQLRLRGVQNLRVIDASVMPDVTSTNTNAPTIMIAERGAELIKDDWDEDNVDYHHEF